jgi:glucose-6-phosphate-specific signal transduction histidine kinase
MMGGLRANVLLRHALVAVGYALGYMLLRQVSWSHWVLFAGFRLTVLLLVPYRYWPALIFGELSQVGYASWSNLDTFGALWSAVMIVPPVALAMPVVKFCRDRLGMIPARGPVRMSVVLGCAMVVSGIWTAANATALAVAVVPANTPAFDYKVECARWFLGNYLGILTLVPLVLMARWAWPRRQAAGDGVLARVLRSRLALDTCIFLLPLLALLVWIGLDASEGSRQMARMLMFLPVIGLALRHGWQGAAIGGTAASIVVAFTMPALYDATTLQSELFIAFAVTTMLLFGSQISALSYKGSQRLFHADQTLDLARRIHSQNEVHLRRTARALERINESAHANEEVIFDRFRQLWPAADTRELRRHTAASREQLFELADGLQPANLDRHGLIATLRHGGMARALDGYGIGYWCRGYGDVGELPKAMQLGMHRLVCEAVSYQCSNHSVSELAVRIRSGLLQGRRWAVIQVDSVHSDDPELRVRGSDSLYRLAATGLGLGAMRDRAALYEGTVRQRALEYGDRVSIIVHETGSAAASRVAPVADATPVFVTGD